jgi:hypothetical protein
VIGAGEVTSPVVGGVIGVSVGSGWFIAGSTRFGTLGVTFTCLPEAETLSIVDWSIFAFDWSIFTAPQGHIVTPSLSFFFVAILPCICWYLSSVLIL